MDKWFREDMEVHPTIFSETIFVQMFVKVITWCSLCQHRWFRINHALTTGGQTTLKFLFQFISQASHRL